MAEFDKAALLADQEFETGDFEVPGMGVIEYRGLSRAELMRVHKLGEESGIAAAEAFMAHRACVNPKFSIEEVKKWQNLPVGKYLDGLMEGINRISGVEEGSGKEATLQFPD